MKEVHGRTQSAWIAFIEGVMKVLRWPRRSFHVRGRYCLLYRSVDIYQSVYNTLCTAWYYFRPSLQAVSCWSEELCRMNSAVVWNMVGTLSIHEKYAMFIDKVSEMKAEICAGVRREELSKANLIMSHLSLLEFPSFLERLKMLQDSFQTMCSRWSRLNWYVIYILGYLKCEKTVLYAMQAPETYVLERDGVLPLSGFLCV